MPHDRQFYTPEVGTELKADNTIFDVQAWRQDTTDKLSSGVTTITTPHLRAHQGRVFTGRVSSDSLANGSSISIYFKTGLNSDTAPHIIFDMSGSVKFRMEVFEGATATASTGVDVAAVNKNRQSSNTSSVISNSSVTGSYTQNATITGTGTLLLRDSISSGHKLGGTIDFDRELVMKEDTTYLLRLTSLDNANFCKLNIDWYEPQ